MPSEICQTVVMFTFKVAKNLLLADLPVNLPVNLLVNLRVYFIADLLVDLPVDLLADLLDGKHMKLMLFEVAETKNALAFNAGSNLCIFFRN